MSPTRAAGLGGKLTSWVAAHCGDGASATSVRRLAGHSSITVAFDVTTAGAGEPVERLVLRLPPAGVRREGTTDVLRQVPLLQAMERHGVPVPRVRWWGEDERWFGVPYLVVEFVDGTSVGGDLFVLREPPPLSPTQVEARFGQAIDALAAIHRVDWQRELPGWDRPHPLSEEVGRWLRFFDKAPEPGWAEEGHELSHRLACSTPPEPDPGVVHADYYTNNWLFHGERLAAVLDWEGSFIGPRLADLGWVCMMYDPGSWAPSHRPRIAWAPPAGFFVARYEAASGSPPDSVPWYRALAGYRMAALSTHYLRLHRLGRRHDPAWEDIGRSVQYLLRRATQLLDG